MHYDESVAGAGAGRNSDVVIIGGGFAGLAAAVDLAESGRKVTLLERRPFLGGRAYSLIDKTTGDTVDNGQHLMMGCYHHTLSFLDKIGMTDRLKFQPSPRVEFLSPGGGKATFACPPFPAPLHLLAGLARLSSISWGDRLRALRVGMALRRLNGSRERLADITVRQWLTELGQSKRIQECFWNPVALATLNENPDIASADMFVRVLEQAFMHSKQDSTMVISRVGLSDLYTEGAARFLEANGGEIRHNVTVSRINACDDRVTSLTLADGSKFSAPVIISAVPYFALRDILDPAIVDRDFPGLREMRSAPIVSINIWYERPVTSIEFAGLLDSPIEWVFNRNAILGSAQDLPQHLALVISGAHDLAARSREDLAAIGVREMERFFPLARLQKPQHTYVIKEQHATLSHGIGMARHRPGQKTPYHNFYLAGDWTSTGLPATIEGAVWSGQECARLIELASRQITS